MIEETKKKIHFVPYTATKGREKDTSAAPTININIKHSKLVFGRTVIQETGMQDKFFRLFYDPTKKIIGWQVRSQFQLANLKNWKLCKPNKTNGCYSVQIKKLLEQFNGTLTKESYKSVPVQKYREIGQLSEFKDEIFYFVELVNEPDELRKGIGNKTIEDMVTI